MLPLLGTLLFALIGIAALVIDVGLALTEQARLETAAEMMVNELAFVGSLPDEQLPSDCAGGDLRRNRCIERSFLAPILSPLGADFVSGVDGAEWQRRDRALDGAAIDNRGARLGAFDAIETGLSPAGTGPVRLSRSAPLLFGWAALAPITQGATRPDFPAVQSARAAEGLSPDLPGSGLRAEGFALQAEATFDPGRTVPAMRVGPPLSFPGGATAGLVGLAWRLEDLLDPSASVLLDALLATPESPASRFDVAGSRFESTGGTIVGCLFDAPSFGAHVGQRIQAGATAGAFPQSNAAAYVPIVRDCEGASPILGFLEVAIDAAPDSGTFRVRPARPTRRNASSTPGSTGEAVDIGRVWGTADRLALEGSAVWLQYGLRLPLVENGPPTEAGGTSS